LAAQVRVWVRLPELLLLAQETAPPNALFRRLLPMQALAHPN
jgi:hypothetical protein